MFTGHGAVLRSSLHVPSTHNHRAVEGLVEDPIVEHADQSQGVRDRRCVSLSHVCQAGGGNTSWSSVGEISRNPVRPARLSSVPTLTAVCVCVSKHTIQGTTRHTEVMAVSRPRSVYPIFLCTLVDSLSPTSIFPKQFHGMRLTLAISSREGWVVPRWQSSSVRLPQPCRSLVIGRTTAC
jgi:hypothetical protein